jgi:hypothetical protein
MMKRLFRLPTELVREGCNMTKRDVELRLAHAGYNVRRNENKEVRLKDETAMDATLRNVSCTI